MKNIQSEELEKDGFCVFKNLMPLVDLESIQNTSIKAIKNLSLDHRIRNKSQGSLILIAEYPEFSYLIGHPKLRHMFNRLGFKDPRFSSGYIISKPPLSPALFWHQDWWGWDHPVSYTSEIMQIFVMIYLQDTTPDNGCLRVIPGSHRNPHSLHEEIDAHTEAVSRVENPKDKIYFSTKDEYVVNVSVGDVIIGDSRLIHGTFPNKSLAERTLIVFWYHPNFNNIPKAVQARICEIFNRKDVDTDPKGVNSMSLTHWPEPSRKLIDDLFPICKSGVRPQPWNRNPQW